MKAKHFAMAAALAMAAGAPALTDGSNGAAFGHGGAQLSLPSPPDAMDQRIDIARIEGQVKASSVKKVADFVEKHPDESTAILRSWVHEG